jgi:glycyl-tRNA synthetase beta chain
VVPCSLFGVAAAAESVGHPVLSPEPFPVTGAEDYHARLAERHIFVRPQARRQRLQEGMAKLAAAAGGQVVEDGALLDKLTAMCDVPGVLEGRFEERFLDLPREVLVISLKDHQSAFTVESAEGDLLPVFLTLMDRPDDPRGRVRSGNEWVVAARLADGRFFYDEDRKKKLPQHAEGLDRLTFHVKLGSYAAKAARLEGLVEALCRALRQDSEIEESRRAASLLKADLVTEMVKEFTDLQGVVGGIYAREEGEPPAVWQAIYDQYLPASQDDDLPRGIVGRLTALADRLDTLAGMFGLGLIPSGSKDPFGLRRAAQGVVRILLEGELPLDWEAAVVEAVELYGDTLERSPEEVLDALRPFLLDRVKFLLGRRGLEYDEIDAALLAGDRAGHTDLPKLAARAEAVQQIRGEAGFLSVVLSAKRIANILKEQPERELDPSKLVEPAEKALYAAYQELEGQVSAAVEAGDYRAALAPIGGLAEVLETFFTEVMVMAEDEELRNQRIALLQAIDRLTSSTARLTELVVDKAEHR